MAKLRRFDFKEYSYEDVTNFKVGQLKEVTPKSLYELEEVLKIAIDDKIPLYPVSTGLNWGMGSKVPVDENSIVVNLSKLNQILDYDEFTGTVVIEPGVTQEQLSNFLKNKSSPYYLDVTGSSKETSVMGNTLERGIAYNSLRVVSVMGLEVLTGKGELIRTGSWRLANSQTQNSYKYGVGADLTGLFFQSNFGIVTKMIFKLKKYQSSYYSVQVKFFSFEHLIKCLDTYSVLFEEGTINSIFHIGNSERAKGAIIPYMRKILEVNGCDSSEAHAERLLSRILNVEWNATGLISGSKGEAKHKVKRLKAQLSPYAKIEVINMKLIDRLHKILAPFKKFGMTNILIGTKPFRTLYFGIPTNAALGSVLSHEEFSSGVNLAQLVDKSNRGFSYCLPITKLGAENCQDMVNIINECASLFNFQASITLNPILPHVLEAVVSIEYDKTNSEQAAQCIRQMQLKLNEQGHYSYRTNIKDMDLYFEDQSYLSYLREIKRIFDPDNLISRGRYLPGQ